MNSATIFFALAAVIVSASASITPVTPEQQQQEHQEQQQYAQASAMQPIAINAVPIDVYRQAYRQAYVPITDQKAAADGDANKGQYSLVQPVNYIAQPVGYPAFQGQVINAQPAGNYYHSYPVGNPLGLGARLGANIHISPAARGFALGGLTGLVVGHASRGLLAGSLAGPIGLGLGGAFNTPALGLGLGAGAAALLG
jgi:hypothetical protein